MKLDRVTMTGADDSVSPEELAVISKEFPFVEWGILASESFSPDGGFRFPSHTWIQNLQTAAIGRNLNLSLHLCGKWVRELLLGRIAYPAFIIEQFQRIQLNFHAERTSCKPYAFFEALRSIEHREFIFQIDGNGGNEHLQSIYDLNDDQVKAFALFDISGGAGVLPTHWPEPIYMDNDMDYSYHGYAGGLGPQNLAEQLPLIETAASHARIWIDMETHVRSDDGSRFDLAKVRKCLEICEPWINAAVRDSAAPRA